MTPCEPPDWASHLHQSDTLLLFSLHESLSQAALWSPERPHMHFRPVPADIWTQPLLASSGVVEVGVEEEEWWWWRRRRRRRTGGGGGGGGAGATRFTRLRLMRPSLFTGHSCRAGALQGGPGGPSLLRQHLRSGGEDGPSRDPRQPQRGAQPQIPRR